MAQSGLTPETYGLRVRAHPDGLLVTALNKMCHARRLELSYAGQLVQTAHFAIDSGIRERNWKAMERFLNNLETPEPHGRAGNPTAWLWRDIAAARLLEVIQPEEFTIHPECMKIDSKRLSDFIRRQNEQGELTRWTVALVSNTQAGRGAQRVLAGRTIGLVVRKGESNGGVFTTTKANIQSPSHQALDLYQWVLNDESLGLLLAKQTGDGPLFDAEEVQLLKGLAAKGQSLHEAARELTRLRSRLEGGDELVALPDFPNGRIAREVRPVSHGLLLVYAIVPGEQTLPRDESPYLGLAFSFPTSHTARAVAYEANRRLIDELRDGEYED